METKKDYRRNWYKENKERLKELKKVYYQNNKIPQRERDLLSRYGISIKDYDLMRENQEYKCKCCGVTEQTLLELYPNSHHKTLCVDHCHTTQKVRGLLCNKCNTFIGFLEARSQHFEKAVSYLNESKE
jgi:hypothetical protein